MRTPSKANAWTYPAGQFDEGSKVLSAARGAAHHASPVTPKKKRPDSHGCT